MTVSRIVSLLPAATEILFALGAGERVVGVSHECDFPDAARSLPRVTRTSIDPHASSSAIDAAVRERAIAGLSLYDVDEDLLRSLAPDVIVTQDACAVCAIPSAEVHAATCRAIGRDVAIVSLAPRTLDDVREDVRRVAAAIDVDPARVIDAMDARLREVASARGAPRGVLVLEWLDRPMVAGHWTPELVRIAGGVPVLAHEGAPTRAIEWSEIHAAADAIEVVLLAPCGFPIAQIERELDAVKTKLGPLADRPLWIADGNAYFNRPGPRIVETAAIVWSALRPEMPSLAPVGSLRAVI
ncbi:hypothetical protein [Sandaracinus amylolyticus]|uniref:hypothetical protein n=1 Tax=Sandaracinus amylolyticus TaxID=927083 RepID=UPI001F28357F|nr:hypothetical protein [Sandaracinus amylolyticus]UJR80666.1 Iron complex transport system substrate-binding protein [Sandaracinus amylolyticus]